MASKAEYIQLESGDDVASVRDRLSFMRGNRVLLIWPEDGTCLTRKLDLVLVQREAMRRAIRLALVTHDPQVIQYAEELNISAYETIGASERGRWKRGRSKTFTSRLHRPKDEPVPEDLREVASRIQADEREAGRRGRLIRALAILALFLVTIAILGYVLLPSATVIVMPAQNAIYATVQISADPQIPSIDIENRLIPAYRLSVQLEEEGTIQTSGTRDLGNASATGSVVFINQTDEAVSIPAGTTVTTSSGQVIEFRTTQEGNLPGGVGFQIEVPVEAVQNSAGEVGNVDSGTINTVVGPFANRVTVRNISPTTGGSSRAQRVVTEADVATLRATVRQQIQNRAFLEMKARLSENQCIVLETIRIAEERSDWQTFSANVGDPVDTLSLNMRAVVDATYLDEQLTHQVVYAQLSGQVREGQSIKPSSITYGHGCESVDGIDPITGRITFSMNGSGVVSATIDVDEVRARLAGNSLNDAMAYLVTGLPLQEGRMPEILISPYWFSSMPLLPGRIAVQVVDAPGV